MADSLQTFQREFAAALRSDGLAQGTAPWARQPGFAVYRNTTRLACIDALQANYPSVAQLVGETWFRDAAAVFVAAYPPHDPVLARYGESFAVFLESFEPARELAYLPGMARLDRCWTEAHLAADAPPLTATALATLTPAALAALPLRPHPAARWIAFATLPVYTIWRRHREALPLDADLSWVGEAVLISRPADAVAWQAIGAAAVAFLDASAECEPFAVAANAAASADPADAIDAWLPALVRAGAFGPVAGLR